MAFGFVRGQPNQRLKLPAPALQQLRFTLWDSVL